MCHTGEVNVYSMGEHPATDETSDLRSLNNRIHQVIQLTTSEIEAKAHLSLLDTSFLSNVFFDLFIWLFNL